MAHYTFIDDATPGIVTEVIVGNDERSDDGTALTLHWESIYAAVRGQRCRRTSYGTSAGVHLGGGTPYRGTYAGIGYEWHEDLGIFAPPCPGEGWTLDAATATWVQDTPGGDL